MNEYIEQNKIPFFHPTNGTSWIILSDIEQQIKEKIEKIGKPLSEWNIHIYRGILTGCNEAFIIDKVKRDEFIKKSPKCAEIIRPILRGRDISRYQVNFAGQYLITIPAGFTNKYRKNVDAEKWFSSTYSAIYEHLKSVGTKLNTKIKGKGIFRRDDMGNYWWELRSCAYMEDFSKQKIIWGEISDKSKFALDTEGKYIPEATTFLMTGKHLQYLLCILNSNFAEWFFSKLGTTTGVGTVRWKKYTLEQLLIPVIFDSEMSKFEILVSDFNEGIISLNDLENKSNNLIYKLLNISLHEKDFLENFITTH